MGKWKKKKKERKKIKRGGKRNETILLCLASPASLFRKQKGKEGRPFTTLTLGLRFKAGDVVRVHKYITKELLPNLK